MSQTLADVERAFILATLLEMGGNRTHTAHSLGICIRTLRQKLAIYKSAGFYVMDNPNAATAPHMSKRCVAKPRKCLGGFCNFCKGVRT